MLQYKYPNIKKTLINRYLEQKLHVSFLPKIIHKPTTHSLSINILENLLVQGHIIDKTGLKRPF